MKFFSTILLSLLLAACSVNPSRAYPPAPGYVIEGVDVGDQVDVFLNDSTRHRFLVTRVDSLGLHGSDVSFAYSDMQAVVVMPQENTALSVLSAVLSRGLSY
jgi:hypothetical protein